MVQEKTVGPSNLVSRSRPAVGNGPDPPRELVLPEPIEQALEEVVLPLVRDRVQAAAHEPLSE